MIGIVSSALGALKGAASWLVPSVLSAGGQIAQNASARREAQRQMDFQKMMSDTAVQRGQADIRAAGLNPVLAYGYQAGVTGGSKADVGNVLGAGVSSALAAKANQAQVALLQEQMRRASYEADIAGFNQTVEDAKSAPYVTGPIRDLVAKVTYENLQADFAEALDRKRQAAFNAAMDPFQRSKLRAETERLNLALPQARTYSELYNALFGGIQFGKQTIDRMKQASKISDIDFQRQWQDSQRRK